MNRSLRIRRLACRPARRGVLVAPAAFTDPERGVVRCAAAPLLAVPDPADGLPVQPGGQVHGVDEREPDAELLPGVLVTVSYLDRDGQAGGLALIAHRDDGERAAASIIERWLPVFRSRRVLVADTPQLCPGAAAALAVIEDALAAADAPVYVVGRPVVPPGALDRPGLAAVDDLDRVPAGARVVFPAHGVSLQVRTEAAARGLTVHDGTCPLVAAAQRDAVAYANRGDTVVVIGHPDHAVVPPLAACAGKGAVITRERDLPDLPDGDVSFVVDPAMPADEVLPVVRDLRQRIPGLRGHHFDVLCEVASDRAQCIASVAAASDLMVVIAGTQPDPEGADAAIVAARAGTEVRLITSLSQLGPSHLAGAATVGVTATLSAPDGAVSELLAALSGLGPASAVRRTVRTGRDTGGAGEQRPDRRRRAEWPQPGSQQPQRT